MPALLFKKAVQNKTTEKLWSLQEMGASDGEPDVVDDNQQTGVITFYDCSAESPKDRRSICYDQKALDSRKAHKSADSAMNMAAEMGSNC